MWDAGPVAGYKGVDALAQHGLHHVGRGPLAPKAEVVERAVGPQRGQQRPAALVGYCVVCEAEAGETALGTEGGGQGGGAVVASEVTACAKVVQSIHSIVHSIVHHSARQTVLCIQHSVSLYLLYLVNYIKQTYVEVAEGGISSKGASEDRHAVAGDGVGVEAHAGQDLSVAHVWRTSHGGVAPYCPVMKEHIS